jgi:hypothetical protein
MSQIIAEKGPFDKLHPDLRTEVPVSDRAGFPLSVIRFQSEKNCLTSLYVLPCDLRPR